MIVLDKLGWPVERIRGRPIHYLLRCIIHGRRIISRKTWEAHRFLIRMADRTRSKRALDHDVEYPLGKLFQWCYERDLRGAHYVDVVVRVNGKDQRFEADWLKEISNQMRHVQVEGCSQAPAESERR